MKLLSTLSESEIQPLREQIRSYRENLNLDPNLRDDEIVEDDHGWGLAALSLPTGVVLERGDQIRVTKIDERFTQGLPADEIEDLKSFVGEQFSIVHINFDESLLVEKEWRDEEGVIRGHGLAVFPGQYEIIDKQ